MNEEGNIRTTKEGIIENQVFKLYKGIEILSTNGSVNLDKEQR